MKYVIKSIFCMLYLFIASTWLWNFSNIFCQLFDFQNLSFVSTSVLRFAPFSFLDHLIIHYYACTTDPFNSIQFSQCCQLLTIKLILIFAQLIWLISEILSPHHSFSLPSSIQLSHMQHYLTSTIIINLPLRQLRKY